MRERTEAMLEPRFWGFWWRAHLGRLYYWCWGLRGLVGFDGFHSSQRRSARSIRRVRRRSYWKWGLANHFIAPNPTNKSNHLGSHIRNRMCCWEAALQVVETCPCPPKMSQGDMLHPTAPLSATHLVFKLLPYAMLYQSVPVCIYWSQSLLLN